MSEETSTPPSKPVPVPTADSAPYWAAARQHRLTIQFCTACGKGRFPPSSRCPHCLSADAEWRAVSGAGRIFSFVVVHRISDRAFATEVPYTVAIIELAEGPRMLSNIVGVSPDEVDIGMAVTVVFDDVSPEIAIPKFVRAAAP